MRQLVVPLQMPPRLDEKDFIVSSHNQVAYSWLNRWPNWQNGLHTTLLWGSKGAGKSHLIRFWGQNNEATFIDNCEQDPRDLAANNPLIICDNIDKWGQLEWVFHLFNTAFEYKSSLVFTMQRHPNEWAKSLPDLHSRLLKSMIIELTLPDDKALMQLMQKRFHDFGITADDAVLSYIVKRSPRDYVSIHAIVDKLNKEAASKGQRVSIPLIKDTFQW